MTENTYTAALARIAEIARDALASSDAPAPADRACHLLTLPPELEAQAAETARRINPANAPLRELMTGPPEVERLVVDTTRYWGPSPRQLTVSFLESTPTDLRARILGHMNAWSTATCISFVETAGTGQVRITRNGADFASHLGTNILSIPQNQPTMWLGGFTMSTSESEYRRVVRHEAGHTLGFPHEHLRREFVSRIDPTKAYAYYFANGGWDKAKTDFNVLTPLDENSVFGNVPDQTSIMCYFIPGAVTVDGLPITGGTDITPNDYGFAGLIYPKPFPSFPPFPFAPSDTNGAESADVRV